jgi:conjugal transfer/type IV secretion protein DotA/TraY
MDRLRRLGILLVLAALPSPVVAQTTSKQIFTPTTDDLALANLKKLLGCTVDALWNSTTCSETRPLTTALAYFNVACLIVATLVACYLLYSMVADTANDGQIFGRSIETRYTLLRVGLGAILALPVSSGLSVVQLLVIQVALWGSGGGDTLWAKVAPTMLAGMYGSSASAAPTGTYGTDYALRGKIAKALRARTLGYVCAKLMDDYANRLSGITGTVSATGPTTTTGDSVFATDTMTVYGFSSTSYWGIAEPCGVVQYRNLDIATVDADSSGVSDRLIAAVSQAENAAVQSAMSTIDSTAAANAERIVNAARDGTAIRESVKTAVESATATVSSALASALQSNAAEVQAAEREYLSNATDNGWLGAILWQRSMVATYAKLSTMTEAVNFEYREPPDPSTSISFFSRWGSAYQALVDKMQDVYPYARSFDAYYDSFAQAAPVPVASDAAAADQSSSWSVAGWVASAYQTILRQLATAESSTWKDPVVEIQATGHVFAKTAAGFGLASAAGKLVETVTGGVGSVVAGGLSAFSWAAMWCFIVPGFLLSGVGPFLFVIQFLFAVLNWFLVIAEAMVAVPLWLLDKFAPTRSPGLFAGNMTGYMFLLGILIRPFLIVIGLLVSLLVLRVGLDIANLFFRGALAALSPDGPGTIIVGLGGLVVYSGLLFTLLTFSSAFIGQVPELVMSWVDTHLVHRRDGAAHVASGLSGWLPTRTAAVAGATGRAIEGAGSEMSKRRQLLSRQRGERPPRQGGKP